MPKPHLHRCFTDVTSAANIAIPKGTAQRKLPKLVEINRDKYGLKQGYTTVIPGAT